MKRSAGLIAVLLLFAPKGALAGHGLDVDAWLQRPGVKLLALEFYATWCKPCMEAVPKWKALHDRYRKDGLRLVVVATQDPKGGCSSPGWSPDDVLCDDDGRLAERFGAGNLPAAFLWSWQGHLLATKAHVEEVEEKIKGWMRDVPRVDVEIGEVAARGAKGGISKSALRDLVRNQLINQDKLPVVATEEERKKLDAIKKRSFEAHYDDSLQCEVGKDLSANSLLQVFVKDSGSRPRLQMSLLSAERGCLVASANVDWVAKKAATSVAEAVAELLQKLKTEAQAPWAIAASSRGEGARQETRDWTPDQGGDVIVSFASTPPGAVVLIDGGLLCQQSPCSRNVRMGSHTVAMEKERYARRSESVSVKEGTQIEWKLDENFGRIDLETEPPGLEVKVDGQPAGTSPHQGMEVSVGRHRVSVSDRCFLDAESDVSVGRGAAERVKLTMKAREGAVDARAEDVKGNALSAEVYVGGKLLGKTPGVYKVPLCTAEVELREAKLGAFVVPVKIEERKTVTVEGVLDPSVGSEEDKSGPALREVESSLRDNRKTRLQPRAKSLLVNEIAGLESLFQTTPKNAKDRPQLARRLAESYVELEMGALRDKNEKTQQAARNKAIQYFTLIVKEFPDYVALDEVRYYLALEYESANDRANARKVQYELIQKNPQSKYIPHAFATFALFFENEAQGDPAKWPLAEESWKKVAAYPPPENKIAGLAWYHLARCALKKDGDRAKAAGALKKAIEFGPPKLKEIAEAELASLERRPAARKILQDVPY